MRFQIEWRWEDGRRSWGAFYPTQSEAEANARLKMPWKGGAVVVEWVAVDGSPGMTWAVKRAQFTH